MSTRERGFQSTPSGGKATQALAVSGNVVMVSIHAFRGEGDKPVTGLIFVGCGFNPRLPGGRRHIVIDNPQTIYRFNPRLPGGRRPAESGIVPDGGGVSIHAFRGEGDKITQ